VPAHATFAPIAFLMFLTGIGIPILATFNAGLGTQLGGAPAATLVLFAVGLMIAAVIVALTGGLPPRSSFTFGRPYLYSGAAFMLFYALSVTWAAPRIGVGNAVFFVLLGQLVAAAVIDHFGLWGALKTGMTLRRTAGIAVMALGVYLARKPV
jgi:transporter family-2 protein